VIRKVVVLVRKVVVLVETGRKAKVQRKEKDKKRRGWGGFG
jgi:hypothetical protein